MRAPLLKAETPSKFRKAWENYFCLFFLLLVYFCHVSFHRPNHHASHHTTEVSVGSNEATTQLIRIHFWIGDFTNLMENSKHFRGVNTVKYEPFDQFCPYGTPSCEHICDERLLGKDPSSAVCVSTQSYSVKEGRECWPTTDMRCWGIENFVWDGSKEWRVIGNDLIGEPGMTWIHLQSMVHPYAHLIVFGHGKVTSFDVMSRQFTRSKKLMETLDSIPMEIGIIFSGHSMGAAWATYTHTFLGMRQKPHSKRFVVATGMPLASREYNQLFRSERRHTKILLLSLESQGRIFTDVKMIEHTKDLPNAVSLPQFAYLCNIDGGTFMCKDPQPERFNIDESLAALHNNFNNPIVSFLHEFSSYRQCFNSCTLKFLQQDLKYGANVDDFQSRPLPSADAFPPLPVGADAPEAIDPPDLPPIAHSEVQSSVPTSLHMESQSTALIPQHSSNSAFAPPNPATFATAFPPGSSSNSQAGPSTSSSQVLPQAPVQLNYAPFFQFMNVYNPDSGGMPTSLHASVPPSAISHQSSRLRWKPTRVFQEGFHPATAPNPPRAAESSSSQRRNPDSSHWKTPQVLHQGSNPARIPPLEGTSQSTHDLPTMEDASRGLVALSAAANTPLQGLLSLSALGSATQWYSGQSREPKEAQSTATSASASLQGISKKRNYASADDIRDRLYVILEDEKPSSNETFEEYRNRVIAIVREYFKIKKCQVKKETVSRDWFIQSVRLAYDDFFRRNPQDLE